MPDQFTGAPVPVTAAPVQETATALPTRVQQARVPQGRFDPQQPWQRSEQAAITDRGRAYGFTRDQGHGQQPGRRSQHGGQHIYRAPTEYLAHRAADHA